MPKPTYISQILEFIAARGWDVYIVSMDMSPAGLSYVPSLDIYIIGDGNNKVAFTLAMVDSVRFESEHVVQIEIS